MAMMMAMMMTTTCTAVVRPVQALAPTTLIVACRRQRLLTPRPFYMTTGVRRLLFTTTNNDNDQRAESDDINVAAPLDDNTTGSPSRISVSGLVYDSNNGHNDSTSLEEIAAAPKVTLFTRHGCTLCDQVKDVLQQVRSSLDHSLWQVDITDPEHIEWYHKYKYDIPVVHLGGKYWIKHRLTVDEARQGLEEAATAAAAATTSSGSSSSGNEFVARPGEPNAAKLERRPSQ